MKRLFSISAIVVLAGLLLAPGVAMGTWPEAPAAYTITDLGTLGGRESVATGINASGRVVGFADTTHGTHHAFLWRSGRMTDLGTLPGGERSDAWAINDGGEIVGSCTVRGERHAVLWRKAAGGSAES